MTELKDIPIVIEKNNALKITKGLMISSLGSLLTVGIAFISQVDLGQWASLTYLVVTSLLFLLSKYGFDTTKARQTAEGILLEGSKAFSLNKDDMRKWGKSLLITSSGTFLVIASQYLSAQDLGMMAPVVITVITTGINVLRKYGFNG